MKVNQKNWEGMSFSVDLFSWIKNAFLVLNPLQVLSALSPKPHILEYCFLSHSTTNETKMNTEASQCWKWNVGNKMWDSRTPPIPNKKHTRQLLLLHRFLWVEITLNRKGPSRICPNRPEESVNPWGRPVHLWYFLLPVWRSSQSKAMGSWLFLAVGQVPGVSGLG